MRLALVAILFLGGCGPIVTAIEWGDVNAHRFDNVPRKPLIDTYQMPATQPTTKPESDAIHLPSQDLWFPRPNRPHWI